MGGSILSPSYVMVNRFFHHQEHLPKSPALTLPFAIAPPSPVRRRELQTSSYKGLITISNAAEGSEVRTFEFAKGCRGAALSLYFSGAEADRASTAEAKAGRIWV